MHLYIFFILYSSFDIFLHADTIFIPGFRLPDRPSSGVALLSKTAAGDCLSEQLSQHVYVYVCWLIHSVELRSKETASGTCQWTNYISYWHQNRYKMMHFKKEIILLVGASLAVMWFPLWFCLFNMLFPAQRTCCLWLEGNPIQRIFSCYNVLPIGTKRHILDTKLW